MLRKAPSLEATEAFLVAARAESFRAAADEVALSPSAFSRRIQQLEFFVGVPLFDRSGPKIHLTEVGARYLREIEPAMETIRKATADLQRQRRAAKLRIITSHSFAVSWLLPRLSDLFHRHGLEIDLTITRAAHVLRSGAADLAIWGGADLANDLPSEKIIDLEGVLAAAPVLIDGRRPPCSLDELAGCTVLSTKSTPDIWRYWLTETGYKGKEPAFAAGFEIAHLMYEAAASGLGVALAVPLLTEPFMRDTRLRPCVEVRAPVGSGYHLYFSSAEHRKRSPVRIFADWFAGEVERSLATFESWYGHPNSK
jgi:DNA-binding transcriptional LysR family regulator